MTDEAALGVAIGCFGYPLTCGPVGGWLTDNDTENGSTRVAVDWKPADWTSLTMTEAADLMGFLAKAVAQASA